MPTLTLARFRAGRLTSTWNWTSQIEKKNYYPLFMLTGFKGFDGDFTKDE
jgi:hypothetical protein